MRRLHSQMRGYRRSGCGNPDLSRPRFVTFARRRSAHRDGRISVVSASWRRYAEAWRSGSHVLGLGATPPSGGMGVVVIVLSGVARDSARMTDKRRLARPCEVGAARHRDRDRCAYHLWRESV